MKINPALREASRRSKSGMCRRLLLRHAEAVNKQVKERPKAHQVNGEPSDPPRPLFGSLHVEIDRSDPLMLMAEPGSLGGLVLPLKFRLASGRWANCATRFGVASPVPADRPVGGLAAGMMQQQQHGLLGGG